MKSKRWSKEWWADTVVTGSWFVGIVAVIGVLWIAYAKYAVPWLATKAISGKLAAEHGLSGDMFGGLNTLFAGLAFAFVALAAYFQRQTMRSQREELEAAKAQGALQAFEPLFFQLLNLFREQQQGVHLLVPATVHRPATDLPLAHSDVQEHVRWIAEIASRTFAAGRGSKERALALVRIQTHYLALHRSNEGELGPMFRTLYHAIRLISDSGLPPETQVRYANIARGLLGGEFLMLLMLNCLSEPGAGFKPFVERFGLLKHIRRDPNDEADLFVASFYEPSALVGYDQRLVLWGADGPPALPA